MKRKILALFLAALTALSVLPASAAAKAEVPGMYGLWSESMDAVLTPRRQDAAAISGTAASIGGADQEFYPDAVRLGLEFQGQAGQMYFVAVCKGEPEKPDLAGAVYVDQYTAGADGRVVTVDSRCPYPSSLSNGVYTVFANGVRLGGFRYYAGPNPFRDVHRDDYFYKPVLWAVDQRVTAGINDFEFGPELECTRAQIVTFLWNKEGQPTPKTTVSPFTDVDENDWFFKPVMWAVEQNVTAGIGNGQFGPELVCTRAQAMTFLWKYLDKPEAQAEVSYTDVARTDWFYASVRWAVENGITSGVGGGRFGSEDDCLRAQIVTFLYRAVAQ